MIGTEKKLHVMVLTGWVKDMKNPGSCHECRPRPKELTQEEVKPNNSGIWHAAADLQKLGISKIISWGKNGGRIDLVRTVGRERAKVKGGTREGKGTPGSSVNTSSVLCFVAQNEEDIDGREEIRW